MEERQVCLRKNNFSVVRRMPPNMISEMPILRTDPTGLDTYALSLLIIKVTQLAMEQA